MDNEYLDEYSVRVFRDKETLNITREYWNLKDGPPSRIGGPAYQEFDPATGKKISETYYLDGMVHRAEEQGPACRKWDVKTGNLVYEAYSVYGKTHRSDGKPAVINYHPETGELTEQEFYIRGEEIDPDTGEPVWIDVNADDLHINP